MKKTMLVVMLAVAVAAPVALATPGHGGKKMATYELSGTLSAFTAPVGPTPGSITIAVTKANKAGRPFVGQTLTFPVGPASEVQLGLNSTITDGDAGKVQVKGAPGLTALALQLLAPHVIEDEAGGV